LNKTEIERLYEALKKRAEGAARDLKGQETGDKLRNLYVGCRGFLQTLEIRELTSLIPRKSYFVFADGDRTSRPVNASLYSDSLSSETVQAVLNCAVSAMAPSTITAAIYTIAMSYCCANDILKRGDQKTPGTFFELLIGHLVSSALGVNPTTQITAPTLDLNITLPTDFVFDLGADKSRVHLPIKTSTRERVVQVWAHQRVLDGMHGVARFKGVLVVMAETNKQEKAETVTEVCLPNQWTAYQMYIAQMFRVYYLDLPEPYSRLKDRYPFIQVKQFGDFFFEIDKIERSGLVG